MSEKQEDRESLDLLYLQNEDINITTNYVTCRLITAGNTNQKQFLNLFLENKEPKCLHIFRLYNFTECLKN